jgi:two-component system, cell cycle response regulator DivK
VARVLIIEDNEMNRDMLSRRLQRRGFETVIATDGEEGLAAVGRDKPDVIIMDMGLPVVDGWEATRRLKSSEETRRIPIIALTADAMLGDRDKAFAAGCDDFDTKPVDFARLLKKIDTLLGRAGS